MFEIDYKTSLRQSGIPEMKLNIIFCDTNSTTHNMCFNLTISAGQSGVLRQTMTAVLNGLQPVAKVRWNPS